MTDTAMAQDVNGRNGRAKLELSVLETPRRRAEDRQADALHSEVLGIVILAVGLCLFLALISSQPQDIQNEFHGQTQNWIGPVGAHLADMVQRFLGLSGFLLPLALAWPGVCFFIGRRVRIRWIDVICYPVMLTCASTLAYIWLNGGFVFHYKAGGIVGAYSAEILQALFGVTGTYIIIYATLLLVLLMTTRVSLMSLLKRLRPEPKAQAIPAIQNESVAAARIVEMAEPEPAKEKSATPGLFERFAMWRREHAEKRMAQKAEKAELKAQQAAEKAARKAQKEAEKESAKAAKAAKAARVVQAEPVTSEPSIIDVEFSEMQSPIMLPEPSAEVSKRKKTALPKVCTNASQTSGRFELGGAPAYNREEGFRFKSKKSNDFAYEDSFDLNSSGVGEGSFDVSDADSDTLLAPCIVDAPASSVEMREAPRPQLSGRKPVPEPYEERPLATVAASAASSLPEESRFEVNPAAKAPAAKPEEDEYTLPSLNLLNAIKTVRAEVNREYLLSQAERLAEALSMFHVRGQVTEIHPGPVITMYEFKPDSGTKLSKITGLSDDLAMELAAVKVRIVAPIPGKGVVGFELPNKTREMVLLHEVLSADEFVNGKDFLPLALGKDIEGQPVVTDLAKMPHLLVAGTTGSGKSVGVNGMIVSLLYRYRPEDVRFIMIDPKMIELSVYDGIPHLLLPVVTDSKKAAMALKWVVDEMERRYELMKSAGVREMRSYNKKAQQINPTNAVSVDADGNEIPRKLPYIVVVIDEFADLMMVAGKEVEQCVARIAQKARAAGIHVILATQRPTTDVITGVIKANFPTRIAFQVSSGIDSRTILNTQGAENLLGKGDMLFMPPGTSSLTRVHGAYISDDEVHAVVEFIKAQSEPEYLDESVVFSDGEDADSGDEAADDGGDDRYEEAVRLVAAEGKASASHLQRRMSLGYNRAARLIDQMEHDGLIGPVNGSKPRQINKVSINELISHWDGLC